MLVTVSYSMSAVALKEKVIHFDHLPTVLYLDLRLTVNPGTKTVCG